MRKFHVFAVVLSIMLGGLMWSPRPAEAASTSLLAQPVYVEVYANTYYWPVKAGLSVVDKHTGTYLVYGACRAGYRCIRVSERSGCLWLQEKWRCDWIGATYLWSWGAQLYLNSSHRKDGYTKKVIATAHEGGHTAGLIAHTSTCSDVMQWRLPCWYGGPLPPVRFNSSQSAILATH